jgi:saccharopine dehydrogenase-like NADP-dependent oxidoreductase
MLYPPEVRYVSFQNSLTSTLCTASILTVFKVTTSYVSQAMMELDAAAKEAGIVVMNEIGLDPGIGMFAKICMKTT